MQRVIAAATRQLPSRTVAHHQRALEEVGWSAKEDTLGSKRGGGGRLRSILSPAAPQLRLSSLAPLLLLHTRRACRVETPLCCTIVQVVHRNDVDAVPHRAEPAGRAARAGTSATARAGATFRALDEIKNEAAHLTRVGERHDGEERLLPRAPARKRRRRPRLRLRPLRCFLAPPPLRTCEWDVERGEGDLVEPCRELELGADAAAGEGKFTRFTRHARLLVLNEPARLHCVVLRQPPQLRLERIAVRRTQLRLRDGGKKI